MIFIFHNINQRVLMNNVHFKLLVIDDEELVCEGLSRILKEQGYLVNSVTEGAIALQMIKEREYDLILLDINLPGTNGIDLLPEIRYISPNSLIIMITAYSDVHLAVKAMKAGAYDYFIKSSDHDELLIKIKKGVEIQRLRKDVYKFQESLTREYNIDRFIGTDPKMKEVFNNIRRIAIVPDASVLILGESGTGKELVAKYIHYLSDQRNNPFIAINCASIAPNLCESEFFGHEKGAFTDAKKGKKGVFELAEDGTLFLDEIGSMNLDLQGNLLRVLEERKFRRLGGTKDIQIDIRIIAASNRDINLMVKEDKFRLDLLYRLNMFQIELPPLRNRRGDIAGLAYFFMENFNKSLGKDFHEIDSETQNILYNYDYPGNVRELRNIIERAMILSDGKKITSKHLSIILPSEDRVKDDFNYEKILPLKEMERKYILKIVELCNGNKTEAARKLGISRSTLNLQIKQSDKRNS